MHGNQYIQAKNPRRGFFWISMLALSILVVLSFSLTSFSSITDSATASKNTLQTVDASAEGWTPEEREWVPELPVRLVIPAIDVDAKVQYVGQDPNGSGKMEVPSNFTDVGWYKHGVRPGMRGSAVIAGHLNGRDVPEAVFYDLHTLKVGDEVVIMSEERVEDIFRVVKIETYAHDDPTDDVFKSADGKKRLNLITCSGTWLESENQFDKRTVVFTELLTDVE